jgi:predicted DNA-binding ribbon-helix-helix protein
VRLNSGHSADAFWPALKEIAAAQGIPVSRLIVTIDNERPKWFHQSFVGNPSIRARILSQQNAASLSGTGYTAVLK